MIKFTIQGEPKAKARPRVGRFGTYTPQQTVQYENWVKECYLLQCKNTHLEGQLCARIIAYFGIPKSTNKKNRTAMLRGDICCTKRPDVDNIAKIVLDSLNGLAYDDDSQVVELNIRKMYAEEPRVEVELYENIKL